MQLTTGQNTILLIPTDPVQPTSIYTTSLGPIDSPSSRAGRRAYGQPPAPGGLRPASCRPTSPSCRPPASPGSGRAARDPGRHGPSRHLRGDGGQQTRLISLREQTQEDSRKLPNDGGARANYIPMYRGWGKIWV